MPILFVRHGEKAWANGRKPAHLEGFRHDPPLKGEGELHQTIRLAKARAFTPDVTISSPFRRCVDTASLLLKALDVEKIEVYTTPEIGEYLGNMRKGKVELHPETAKSYTRKQLEQTLATEKIKDLSCRVKKFWEELKLMAETKNIIVVTHNIVIKEILKSMNFEPPTEIPEGGYVFIP